MKFLALLALVIFTFLSISWFTGTKGKPSAKPPLAHKKTFAADHKLKLQKKLTIAKQFIRQKNYNEQICFFIDMSLPSGQSRFFIYDFRKDSVINKGPVAHGNCFESWLDGRRYSNKVGSGCTSLGKYRIGLPYTGKFGYSYKLHGLDSSNSNAFERTVVLHSHNCIPETDSSDEICQSNGCPTVSPGMLAQLKKIINNSAKPLLLWVYD